MKKIRFFFDFEKEEKWLLQMAAQGWHLQSVLFTYTFIKSEPDTEPIRIDFHTFTSQAKYIEYLTLFEDCGWTHIAGYKSCGMHYFLRTKQNATSDIFSDSASEAGRYRRVADMWLGLFACYIAITGSLFTNFSTKSLWQYTLNPRSAFLTPDLWTMSGSHFWSSFLFEFPFAFFRIVTGPLLVFIVLFYGISGVLFLCQYYKSKNKADKLVSRGNIR
jgi:hypothetical protein